MDKLYLKERKKSPFVSPCSLLSFVSIVLLPVLRHSFTPHYSNFLTLSTQYCFFLSSLSLSSLGITQAFTIGYFSSSFHSSFSLLLTTREGIFLPITNFIGEKYTVVMRIAVVTSSFKSPPPSGVSTAFCSPHSIANLA